MFKVPDKANSAQQVVDVQCSSKPHALPDISRGLKKPKLTPWRQLTSWGELQNVHVGDFHKNSEFTHFLGGNQHHHNS